MRQLRWTMSTFVLVAASVPALAQGCGPTRLKVAESVTLDVAPEKAWAMVGDFQDMTWDADTTGASGTGGNTPDKAVRTVTLKSGATLGESLYRYDPVARSYAYHVDHVDITTLPVQNASGTLEVMPADGGAKSTVRWKFAFYRNLAPGEGAPDAADAKAVEAMRHFLRSGLAGLKAKAAPKS